MQWQHYRRFIEHFSLTFASISKSRHGAMLFNLQMKRSQMIWPESTGGIRVRPSPQLPALDLFFHSVWLILYHSNRVNVMTVTEARFEVGRVYPLGKTAWSAKGKHLSLTYPFCFLNAVTAPAVILLSFPCMCQWWAPRNHVQQQTKLRYR